MTAAQWVLHTLSAIGIEVAEKWNPCQTISTIAIQ